MSVAAGGNGWGILCHCGLHRWVEWRREDGKESSAAGWL